MDPNSDSYTQARSEFFNWVVRCFDKVCAPASELPGSELRAPELPLLVRLLQAIGYELDSLNIFAGVSGQGAHAPYTVTITCAQTGLQAVLKSAAPAESEGCVVKQEPKEEMHMIASSLLPVVTPGMDRVTRDVVFQLLAFMCRTESGPRDAQRIWTGSSEPRNPRRTSTDSALHDIQMDTQDMMTSMAGSNEGLSSSPASPLLAGSTGRLELVRQKTWSIDSINELSGACASATKTPTLTSSPIQDQQQQQRQQDDDPSVTERLLEACAKINEALQLLGTGEQPKVPKAQTVAKTKTSTPPSSCVRKGSLSLPRRMAGTSSVRSPSENRGTPVRSSSENRAASTRRFNSPVATTPNTVRRPANICTPAGNIKDRDFRTGSFVNVSNPNLSSASGRSSRQTEGISPTTRSASNLSSVVAGGACARIQLAKKSTANLCGSSGSLPTSPKPRQVIRPSLLRAPSIVNRSKKL